MHLSRPCPHPECSADIKFQTELKDQVCRCLCHTINVIPREQDGEWWLEREGKPDG